MQEQEISLKDQSTSGNHPQGTLTPHQLFNHHLLHPDEPITDEDIRNLKIDSGGVFKDHQLIGEEGKARSANEKKNDQDIVETSGTNEEQHVQSSYDVLGA